MLKTSSSIYTLIIKLFLISWMILFTFWPEGVGIIVAKAYLGFAEEVMSHLH